MRRGALASVGLFFEILHVLTAHRERSRPMPGARAPALGAGALQHPALQAARKACRTGARRCALVAGGSARAHRRCSRAGAVTPR